MSEENRYQHSKKFLKFNDIISHEKSAKFKAKYTVLSNIISRFSVLYIQKICRNLNLSFYLLESFYLKCISVLLGKLVRQNHFNVICMKWCNYN